MTLKRTAAVVNNEKNILTSLKTYFEAEQFTVRTYANTADAQELIEHPADIALLDKTNRPITGVELFRLIRARHAMPVIFLSAWAEELQVELRASDMPADGYISIPASPAVVLQAVRDVLAQSISAAAAPGGTRNASCRGGTSDRPR